MVSLNKMLFKLLFGIKVFFSFAWSIFRNVEVSEHPAEEETSSGPEDPSDDETPSFFVDQSLLPPIAKYCANNDAVPPFGAERVYSIDGTEFRENIDIEKFGHFEVYLNSVNMEGYADDIEMSEDDRHLEMYTQTVPHGVIINSNVYLNHQQWHTLVHVSEATFTCSVCGVFCDETEHVKMDSHTINLNKHKPLYKYDLSITRKINNYYHCGVCNILFHRTEDEEHFSSKEHEDKLLFAINKVSDIMYDFNTHNDKVQNDTYHYSAKAINNNNLDLSSSEDDNENDYVDDNYYNNVNDKYDENYDDQDDEDFYDNVEPLLSLEHSYASMARKPKTHELPKVLEIDLGNKKVTVNYNSWNMVIRPKANRFYCMVCTAFGHVRQQADHCRSLEHVERLAKCAVVDMYEMYLVRQVDDKLYHCGHCNNLQIIHEMEAHIESQHSAHRHFGPATDSPAKQRPATPLKNYAKNNKPINNVARSIFNEENVNDSNDKQVIINKEGQAVKNNDKETTELATIGNLDMYHELRSVNTNLSGDITICAYGRSVKISKMAYNIVCVRDNDFYCGLCECSIEKTNIKQHVNDLQHLILLQRTPFIEAFNIHLFRQIREALHCALCNELIQIIPEMIFSHKFEPKHITSLGDATGQIANKVVPALTEKPIYNNNSNNKTVNAQVSTNTAKSPIPAATNEAAKNIANTEAKIVPNNVKTAVPTIRDERIVQNGAVKVTPDKEIGAAAKSKAPNIDDIEAFTEVKNGVKDMDEDTESSTDSEDSAAEELDLEEYVYVKLGNSYIKITNTSYNTLVEVGDGTKYCFVCAFVVDTELKKHVESRGHTENMEQCKFVDKYKEDLLRQIYLVYHCSICNVLVSRKQLTQHLAWPTHVLQTENTKISGKQRKSDIKAGMKQYTITTQKENIYLNETETKVKIFLNIAIQKENVVSVARKNKIIIFNDNVLKISFDSWHSLNEVANGWKCKVCQCEFGSQEVGNHVASEWHVGNLDKFEKKYTPALIRKINDTTLNCIMCNTEVSNKKHIILEHIQGKKHKKSFDAILEESSVTNSYADCDEDVLTL